MSCHLQWETSRHLAPGSVIAGGHDAESVLTWAQIRVGRDAPIPCFDPVPIISVETVLEAQLLGRPKLRRGVMDFQHAQSAGRNGNAWFAFTAFQQQLSVGDDARKPDGGRSRRGGA